MGSDGADPVFQSADVCWREFELRTFLLMLVNLDPIRLLKLLQLIDIGWHSSMLDKDPCLEWSPLHFILKHAHGAICSVKLIVPGDEWSFVFSCKTSEALPSTGLEEAWTDSSLHLSRNFDLNGTDGNRSMLA